jgi:hypothetical protein
VRASELSVAMLDAVHAGAGPIYFRDRLRY